jgi:O-methyltransferase
MLFARNAPLRVAARRWLEQHLTVRGIYLMLKSRVFWREALNVPKWGFLVRVMSHTVVTYERLSNLYDIARNCELPGAFVECGVWRGGSAAVLATFAARQGRDTYLFDSFEGLPEPRSIDGARAIKRVGGKNSGQLQSTGELVVDESVVEALLFERFRLAKNRIHIHKGWFQNTVPTAKANIQEIAILRLDGDWYDSTKVCLDELYDQVVPGGMIVVDDYGHFEGCRRAIDEFRSERGIHTPLNFSDYSEVVFTRPPAP